MDVVFSTSRLSRGKQTVIYRNFEYVKGEGKRFLHGDLICTYTLSEYISDIYIDGLCIISVKSNFETCRNFVHHYFIYCKLNKR